VRAEILIDGGMARRGHRMLTAMVEAAPIPVCVREAYVGDCEILMTYGTGHAIRRPWWLKHRAKGGRCIGWDLGYWATGDGTMRATLDADHPQLWIREERPERWDAWGIPLREDAKADGPAVIVGLGHKSLTAYGLAPLQWEQGAAARIAKKGRPVVFRPKRVADPRLRRMPVATGAIEDVLRGASLVVCRHSNVAVDACIAGVPVICEDGAAVALYQHGPAPTQEQRLQFMRSLAWWQWKPDEAKDAWTYLLNRLSA
jgi:hypothetical protein